MKKNYLIKTSAIVASVVMAAAANGVTASAKTAAPRTVKRTKKNDIVAVESIELSDAQAVAGKTVSVQMSMETGETCSSYHFIVEYDSQLELENVVGANAYATQDNLISLVGYGSEPFTDNKAIVTFNFLVPDDAELGDTYEIKFNEVVEFSALDFEIEEYEVENSTIEVLESSKKVTDYMVYEKKDSSGNTIETVTGLRGDADGDGQVNAKDAATIANHCANSYTGKTVIESEENLYFANVTETSGTPTARDAAAIANYMAQKSVNDASWDDVIS